MLPNGSTTLKYKRTYIYALVGVVCLAWGLYAATDEIRPPASVQVRLAAGSSVARRYQVAETFAREARKYDVFTEVVPTSGFEDSIRQLVEGKSDLAVVSTALQIPECKKVRVLAGLDVAALHILVRPDLAQEGRPLSELIRGRRVDVGEVGTNDYQVANEVLRYLRLTAADGAGPGDYIELKLGKEVLGELADELQSLNGGKRAEHVRELPDVIMTVATLPGLLVQRLLDTGEYRLAPFANLEPFLLADLQSAAVSEGRVDRVFLEATTIHSGMYQGSSVMPSSDCPAVGLRTLLVARADLPDAAVKRVMQGVFETDFARRVETVSPRAITTPYQLHTAAAAYIDRDKPLAAGKFFELISKGFSIFGAFSAGALSLYGYLRRRRIRRPSEYLDQIRKIDALASGQQAYGEAPVSPEELAKQLDVQLTQLKEEIIRDYCSNRMQGEMALLSILSILTDSRMQLRGPSGRRVETGRIWPNQTLPPWRAAEVGPVPGSERPSTRAA